MSNKYFPLRSKMKSAKARLYCFHHAGGSVCTFKNWIDHFDDVEVMPLELPDRSLDQEKMTFEDVISGALTAISTVNDERPFFLYGHSLGALFAFETAKRLEKDYGLKAGKVFVAGRHAPNRECASTFKCSMGIEGLYKELEKDGGIDKQLLKDEVFQKVFVPMIFNDYRLNEQYKYSGTVLDMPIVALNGSDDPDATFDVVEKWRNLTVSDFKHYIFKGDHFFPYKDSENAVLKVIGEEISEQMGNK